LFARVARLCFARLKLLLIAVEARKPDTNDSCLAINPGPELKLEPHVQGFFIAESAEDVKRSVTIHFCLAFSLFQEILLICLLISLFIYLFNLRQIYKTADTIQSKTSTEPE